MINKYLPSWLNNNFCLSKLEKDSIELYEGKNQYIGYKLLSISTPFHRDKRSLHKNIQGILDIISNAVPESGGEQIVRFWNVLPCINELIEGVEFYRIFNGSRYQVFKDNPIFKVKKYPAATAIGSKDDEILVFALISNHLYRNFENDKQISAYKYSVKYGKKPPCFSRATAIFGQQQVPENVFISGTASIVGEDSCHNHNLRLQCTESVRNINTLIQCIHANTVEQFNANLDYDFTVYYRNAEDCESVNNTLNALLPNNSKVEFIQADICRKELLVEIEAFISTLR